MIVHNALTRWICRRLRDRAVSLALTRDCDFKIGPASDPYMLRWWVIPRNKWFNIYLHAYRHDDDDRACHCHPWHSLSFALSGTVEEIYLNKGQERRREIKPGSVIIRSAKFAHRLVVPEWHAITLFLTGPVIREWGFWCQGARFVPWQQFVDDRDAGRVGRGCE